MKNQILTVLSLFFLFIGSCTVVFANDVDPREIAIDLAVGGMEEGSRPLSDGGGTDKIPGAGLSPGMDTRVTASSSSPDTSAPGGGSPSVDTDITISGSDDTTTTVGANLDATIETGPSEEGFSEPTSADSDRSIIEADASVDTTGGSPTVDADASLDTSAEGGLVDADASTTADVIDQELTSDAGLQIDLGDSTTLLESTLGNEIGTSTAPPDVEADAGLEADIEGTGSGEVLNDEADGLSATVL